MFGICLGYVWDTLGIFFVYLLGIFGIVAVELLLILVAYVFDIAVICL